MSTATEPTIEQRLAALEVAVAAIRRQLTTPATIPPPGASEPATTEPTTSAPIQRARMDDQGRLIPLTPAEAQAKAEQIRAMFDELRSIPSDPDEDDAEFFRAIDSHRPHRPLFEGLY